MNFRDEYKKEISEISPDEAALERIRSGVAKKLAEPETAKKKPLPLRRIAVVGGSIAACLVIGVTAVVITGGGRNLADKMNNMTGINAPTAAASGGSMAGGANAAPNPGSSRPNFNGINGGNADQGGMTNTESVTGNDGYADTVGDISADTSVPAGDATEQEPSSSMARITLDGELLTLEYNGETTVYTEFSNPDSGKDSDNDSELGENAERIEVLLDGEIMFVLIRENEILLFNSENAYLGTFVKSE